VPRPVRTLPGSDESAMNPSVSTVENHGSTVIILAYTSPPTISTPLGEAEGAACASTYPVLPTPPRM
jgi:hypothetical protein